MYLFYFLKSHKNEEHSYKDKPINSHDIIFMNIPDEKIHCPFKISTKNLIYYICFNSKNCVKIFCTNYLVADH